MSSTIMNQQHDLHLYNSNSNCTKGNSNSNSSNTINIADVNVNDNDITNANMNGKSRTRTRINITNSNVNTNVNVKTQKSWRSSGWVPLSYPSLALYQYRCNKHADSNATAIADSNANANVKSNADANANETEIEIELNPFFPLHKDVILAATRELFILDQAIDSSTLQVNVNANANANANVDMDGDGNGDGDVHTNQQNDNQFNYPHIRKRKRNGDATKAAADGTDNATTLTTTDTLARIIIQETIKLKQQSNSNDCDSVNERNTKTLTGPDGNTDSNDNANANAINNIAAGELSAEALTNLLLQNIIDNLGRKDAETHASPIDATRIRTRTLTMDANTNRIRKVSDAGMDAHFVTFASTIASTAASTPIPMPVYVTSNATGWGSGAGTGTGTGSRSIQSPYAAHLAVAAINLTGNTINIESSIQELKHIRNSHDRVDADIDAKEDAHANADADTIAGVDADVNMQTGVAVDADEGMQVTEAEGEFEKNLLLHLQNKHQMPQMLDLSIMVEAYLRKLALEMVYSFRYFVSDKALREFLGYKSPTAKNGRVLELISDFLFDLSHAMFAWEKTEKDMFGNENNITGTVDYKSHDSTICKTLFDSRALRRIGGFEETSLLSHALSIKRLSAKGISWATFAKSASGKNMMIHHRDNLSRVQAGAKRRDKRMKKNPYTILDDRDKTRSRSSSIASTESVGTNGADLKISTNLLSDDLLMQRQQHRSCVSPIVPDLIPITINRAEGKSWGILLAREGSMCVIMRVPDSTDAQLQRGDLVVSICNENHERVNTPTLHSSNTVSPEWFGNAVGIFKRSNVLHLEVRRVHSAGKLMHE